MRVVSSSHKATYLRALLLTPIFLLLVLCVAIASWWFLYSGDLPNFDALSNFSPSVRNLASGCGGQQIGVISYASMGSFLPAAMRAAEGDDSIVSWQIARQLFCKDTPRHLSRQLLEVKAASQIRHRFTSQQLTTIYLNEAYFGDGIYGIDSASLRLYGKAPSQLSPAEAAMLTAMVKSPTRYSPKRHPERAISRRNEVLRNMAERGALTGQEAYAAMQSPVDR